MKIKFISYLLLIFLFSLGISCNPDNNISQNPNPIDTSGTDLKNSHLLFTSQYGSYLDNLYVLNLSGESGIKIKEEDIYLSIWNKMYSLYNNGLYFIRTYTSPENLSPLDSTFKYDITSGSYTFYKTNISSNTIYDGSFTYLDSNGTVKRINTSTDILIWRNKISNSKSWVLFHDNDRLYFKGFDTLFCLNKTNGNVIWKNKISLGVTEFTIYNNSIIYYDFNTLKNINRTDGSLNWEILNIVKRYPINVNTNKSILSLMDNQISLINTDNGSVIWTKTTEQKYLQTYTMDNQSCYFLTDSFRIVRRNISNGEIISTSQKFDSNFYSYYGGVINTYSKFSMINTDSSIIFNSVNKLFAVKKFSNDVIWQFNANSTNIDNLDGFLGLSMLQLHTPNKIIYSNGLVIPK